MREDLVNTQLPADIVQNKCVGGFESLLQSGTLGFVSGLGANSALESSAVVIAIEKVEVPGLPALGNHGGGAFSG